MSSNLFLTYESYYFKRIEKTLSYMIYVGLAIIIVFVPKDLYFVDESLHGAVYFSRTVMFLMTLGILLSLRYIHQCEKKIFFILSFMLLSAVSIVVNYTFVPQQLPFLTSSLIYYLFALVVLAPLLSSRTILIYFILSTVVIYTILTFFEVSDVLVMKTMSHMFPAFIFIYFVTSAIRRDAIRSYKIDYINFKYSHLDGLTALYNRRYWRRKSSFKISKMKKKNFSIVIFDIDDFKHINDTFSHESGDRVIKEISATMLSLSTDKIICGRYGGDEFVMTFLETPKEEVIRMTEQLKEKIHQSTIYFKDQKVDFTLSFGVAQNGASESFYDVLNRADFKLFDAKHEGKNRIVV